MSLAAMVAAAAVVRARRRRAVNDAAAGDLSALRDSAFADAGTGGLPVPGGAVARDKQTAPPAAAAR
ncbi:hypothetical protein ACLQ22_21840 [Micromonospora sp. DT178]|uniref:hypothetical protein n=1 Tax=unclassified Micromonospora TaxID=2617518 RepID=UPI000EAB4CA3|nr:hypothetical protein [Micromonospora sp. M71_S20]RLK25472.1 hypothetical protein DER29_3479 [Micromonospora sp. M71_S20]